MSLKILINNEEVVCNSNIQINEEMLSTSSTILKNCYPKSWEDDKDYTSRYYYPKDYSKCKIINEETIDFEIVGETTQTGTPTPDEPVPIINKSGTIQETIGGLPYTFNLGDIELCKIGDYEDRIYKDNGKWYVEKNIGKVVLDGTENWTYTSGTRERFTISINDIALQPFNSSAPIVAISNYFVGTTWYNLYNNTSLNNALSSHDSNHQLNLRATQFNGSTSDFKTWLSTNKPELIYVSITPTYTEITDPILLEQLNNVGQRLLFCGCIKNTGNINLNPRQPHFVDLQVLDFKTLLSEGDTLNYVITGKTIVEAINQVVNSISDYGFIVGNIQILNPNDVINAYSTLNKTAYDVFQYIADITQSRWTTRMIDENTIAIDFYDPTLMPQADPIENTKEYMCSNKIDDISFSYSTNDYRNKQIMTSDEIIANITQTNTIVADGYSTNFTCENKIGTITNMKVNGVNATFITKNEEELGLTATFVYQPGQNNFESTSTLLAGSIITITYYPIVKGREIILNSGESTRINEQINRNGNISRYENRQDATSSAELQKIGQSYIKYKGKAEINLKVKSEIDLFNVGQIVEYQAPLEELSTDYMVKSKTIDWYVVPDKTYYTYELTSNFNYENAVNYFDNQRAKNQGNIGEGQTITRNIDLEATALIKFYDTNVEEIQVLNPTSLDFALDGVLI